MPVDRPRFANVSCSQCGGDFGPGNHGYSHCDTHSNRREITVLADPTITPTYQDCVCCSARVDAGPKVAHTLDLLAVVHHYGLEHVISGLCAPHRVYWDRSMAELANDANQG